MDWGMENRMAQLIQSDGHALFLPIDHGYFQGPTRNLEQPGKTVEPLLPYADALFVTRGVLRSAIDTRNTKPIVLRVSGGTSMVGDFLRSCLKSCTPTITACEKSIRLAAFVGQDVTSFWWGSLSLASTLAASRSRITSGRSTSAVSCLDSSM